MASLTLQCGSNYVTYGKTYWQMSLGGLQDLEDELSVEDPPFGISLNENPQMVMVVLPSLTL
jgi:hypothetical protein